MKKKIVLLLLSACLLCSCGNKDTSQGVTETPSQPSGVKDEAETVVNDTVAVSEDESAGEEVEEPSVPELPDGHYLLNTEDDPFYQAANGIMTGIYHVEEYSDDFGCAIFSAQNERYNGLTDNGEDSIEEYDKLTWFCASESNNTAYNYEVFARNPDIPFSVIELIL